MRRKKAKKNRNVIKKRRQSEMKRRVKEIKKKIGKYVYNKYMSREIGCHQKRKWNEDRKGVGVKSNKITKF